MIDNKIELDDDNLDDANDDNDEFNSLHNMNIIMDTDYDLETSSTHLDDTSSQQNLKSICIITGNSSFKPNTNKTRSTNNSNTSNYVNAINNYNKHQTTTALRGTKELDNSNKDLLDLSQQTLSSNNANNSINTIDTIDEDLNVNPSSSLIVANTPSANGNSCFQHHSVSATTANVSANLSNKSKQPAVCNRNIESCSSSISSKSSILSNSAIINSTSNQVNSSLNQLTRDNIPGINLPMSNASNSGSINDDGSATSEVINFI
jgi:hypothetical protein